MDNKLYIPYELSTEKEIFSGFGAKELRRTLVGTAVFSVIGVLLFLATVTLAALIVTIIVGLCCSVIFTTKDRNRISVVDQIITMIRFAKEQQRFTYANRDG